MPFNVEPGGIWPGQRISSGTRTPPSYVAVSYTHLDVYKRQRCIRAKRADPRFAPSPARVGQAGSAHRRVRASRAFWAGEGARAGHAQRRCAIPGEGGTKRSPIAAGRARRVPALHEHATLTGEGTAYEAVSYTHLDVYKRQAKDSAKRNTQIGANNP